jgi:very-short-patch-repair endonuclease
MQLPFHQEAHPKIFSNARALRKEMTRAEKALWGILRSRKLHNFKFRRQHPVQSYIADFFCHQAGLVIELDGDIHENKDIAENDNERTAQLEAQGLVVIRFTNDEVLNDLSSVRLKIEHRLLKKNPNQFSPLRLGEGLGVR